MAEPSRVYVALWCKYINGLIILSWIALTGVDVLINVATIFNDNYCDGMSVYVPGIWLTVFFRFVPHDWRMMPIQPFLIFYTASLELSSVLLPTKSTEQILSWKAHSSSPTQEIPRFSWKPKVYHSVYNSLTLATLLSKINPINAIQFYIFKNHFNIILPPTPASSYIFFPSDLQTKILRSFLSSYAQIWRDRLNRVLIVTKHRLSWLQFFVFFLSTSKQIRECRKS